MEKNKNTVEEALLQIRNLEEALQENVKGVLRSTMKEEIKELVKESLNEQAEVEDEEEDVDIEDMGGEEDVEMDMEDMGDEMDSDEEEMDFNMDDEEMDMDDEEEFDADDETVDLTGASDDEVLKVFKAMGDEDGIIVKREDDMIHLEDGEDEYLVQLGESYMEEDEDLTMDDFELGEGETDTLYEIEFNDEDEDYEFNDLEEEFEDDFSEEDYSEQFEEEEMVSLEDQIMEALKSKMRPKGEGIGHGPKFSYDKKPNMGGGFNEKKKEGPKSVGTGKAKFEYKEEKEFGSKKHEYKRKKVDGVEKKSGEDKDGHYKDYEKSETKESVRTNSYPRANKVGNRKGSNQNVNREEIRVRPNTRSVNEEVEMLRERNEEYKKALDVFRTKLNEVAIFNSNLAYATRLFTEHSTTKQEKINILRRFDEVESLKESKNLYRTMKGELTNTTSNEKTITESIEKTVRTPASGSAANLIESKTYENPQFLRMKDLMSKIN
jgi:hypothetical protein